VTDVILLTVAGVAVGWVVRRLLQPVFELPLLARENYRGRSVATAAGVVIPIALVVVEGGRVLLASLDVGQPLTSIRAMVLVAALGFGLLGLIDDLVGSGHARGFRGHLGELSQGRLTTGGLKLVGGIAVAVIIGGARNPHSPGRLLADAALIALAANLANQLDRRPGRVTKVAVVAFVLLVAFAADHASLASIGVVIGAAVALFYDDLRERLMLGDVGANVVGACLGVGAVIAYSFPVRLAVLAVVAVLNLVGELSSFTRLIDAVPPLRALDRAGRRDP
jgi:hypothetical protein